MYTMKQHLHSVLAAIRSEGLYKNERLIATPQSAWIQTASGQRVLNLCANNYLGFASHPEIIKAAKDAMDSHGFGLASVRFICGTQDLHKQLEAKLSVFLGMEDTILYSSCFDANGGLFETLLGAEDAIISDALNHASIIDGVRLCKAQRFRYANNDMADLETQLQATSAARFKWIATDGVFSMDGTIANVKAICDLADRYSAMVMVDDSHAVGFVGKTGRGSHEYNDVMGRVDIITGTFGKALGGAGGGYTSARKEIIELLRQRSRPYLFSNSLAPAIAGAAIKALDLLETLPESLVRLRENTAWYRQALTDAGFTIKPGEHPIVPIMLGDARLAQEMSARMLEKGVYVVGFFYPVVPQGQARIRTQVSAAHTREDLAFAVKCFSEVRDALFNKSQTARKTARSLSPIVSHRGTEITEEDTNPQNPDNPVNPVKKGRPVTYSQDATGLARFADFE